MMRQFSLCRELPGRVDGCAIRTDFRDVLKALRMLGDPEIRDRDRAGLLRRLMFPQNAPQDMLGAFKWFVRCGDMEDRPGGAKDFDYEQDAMEIYAAFRAVYGIDLMAADHLHWWVFTALLNGLFSTDNALSAKVRMRHLDDAEGVRKAAIAQAKENVALKTQLGRAEMNVEQEFKRRLMAGLPVDDLLGEGGQRPTSESDLENHRSVPGAHNEGSRRLTSDGECSHSTSVPSAVRRWARRMTGEGEVIKCRTER